MLLKGVVGFVVGGLLGSCGASSLATLFAGLALANAIDGDAGITIVVLAAIATITVVGGIGGAVLGYCIGADIKLG